MNHALVLIARLSVCHGQRGPRAGAASLALGRPRVARESAPCSGKPAWHTLCCTPVAMHRSRALFVGLACAVATLLEARRVPAQVTSGPTVNATLDPYPHRIVNGADLGETTRPMNLTPLGISYSDCAADMTLNFNVSVAGFDGTENLQIWASRSSDCTAAADRGIGGATVPLCWLLGQDIFVSTTASTRPYSVRVQDAVGPQNNPPAAGSGYQRQGPEACHAQSTYTPVPINIAFVPVDSSGNYVGT